MKRSFLYIVFQLLLNHKNTHTIGTVYFHLMGIYHARYNVQLVGTHENVLLGLIFNCADINIDLVDQYMDILHNNSKHTSNVVMHILIMDIHTCLPYPCQMMF